MIAALPTVQQVTGGGLDDRPYDSPIRDALLETLFASGSDLALLPVGDVFGWRDRINDPSVVSDTNWTFRLPWPSDRLHEIPEALERQQTLRAWADHHQRR
jgi:4-alpha-glucanotransferase